MSRQWESSRRKRCADALVRSLPLLLFIVFPLLFDLLRTTIQNSSEHIIFSSKKINFCFYILFIYDDGINELRDFQPLFIKET